jgi:hypothetical protein
VRDDARMHLVVIFGPPAVGKMTVGHELTLRTGYKLFHNHMTVEPVLDIFEFGSPPFGRLVNEFRRRILEEAADSDLPGLVFTFVWGLDDEDDKRLVEEYVDLVEARGGRVSFVELYAEQAERLHRNGTEFRLDRKRSKRDLEFSRSNLLALDEEWLMNSPPGESTIAHDLWRHRDYLRIDNTALEAAEVAEKVVAAFGLSG